MDKTAAVADLTNLMSKFTSYIGKRLPTDVSEKLGELREQEVNFLAKEVYESMRQNQEAADKLDRPSCQDTGVIQYFLTAGANFPLLGELESILEGATLGATKEGPGENPSVPQWQKSKGWLIVTAALELSRNQITHFYSRAKNTTEMIKMVQRLLEEYGDVRTLYLSWDAASWHMSKELLAFVDTHNRQCAASPRLELVPLPASAQFLNVIESVFSGMARAIIHCSDYSSVNAACEAIDRYFAERNRHYAENPKRAGKRIWGKERTEVEFDPANNCKDPAYR